VTFAKSLTSKLRQFFRLCEHALNKPSQSRSSSSDSFISQSSQSPPKSRTPSPSDSGTPAPPNRHHISAAECIYSLDEKHPQFWFHFVLFCLHWCKQLTVIVPAHAVRWATSAIGRWK
jgi:hypothetical protein